MERNTYSINFGARKTKARKDGTTPIEATITVNGKRANFSTGRKVRLEDWNVAKQRVKGTSEQANLINAYLQQIKNKLAKLELQLLERGYIITATLLRMHILII